MTGKNRLLSAAQKEALAFRPLTYWPESLNRDQLLARIKGQARRELARKALEEGGIAALHEVFARSELTDDQRDAWGAFHPAAMGGEFLPSQAEGEVEIARISLQSVTSDQISIRARFETGKIHYRVQDEYDSVFELSVESSEQPFSLGEFIEFIDSSVQQHDAALGGLLQSHWNWAYENETPAEEAVEFAGIGSAWYPGLSAWYYDVESDWLAEREPEDDVA
jgi:hypothetical protein